MYLSYSGGCRSHVLSVNEDVHGVITAPFHPDTVPNLHKQTHKHTHTNELPGFTSLLLGKVNRI